MRRNLFLFIVSDILSQFGAGVILAALNWYIIAVYNLNSMVAMIVNINVLAGLFTSCLAIYFLRLIDAKVAVVISYILRILCIAIPIILLKFHIAEQVAVYIVALSNGTGWNLYFPASKDILSSFAKEDNVLEINSLAEVSMQVGMFSAGLIAGILYHYIGFENILLFSLILFTSSLILFASVRFPKNNRESRKGTDFKLNTYLNGQKWLVVLGIVLYIPFVASNVINTALPGYVQEHLHGNSINYGAIDTMYGIGACLAGFLLPLLAKRITENKLIIAFLFSALILGGILVLNQSLVMTAGYIFALGLVGPSVRTIVYTKAMQIVPEHLLSSLVSFWNFINLICQFIANYFVGKIMDGIGPQWGFSVYASLMLVGLILFFSIQSNYSRKARDV